ncbi:hypothetical protein PGT21_002605 [Puccinia graminis f. sp. tritici]|uniref:Uncharacterized protein n=1 Tax=Puccinia graminis f. sp. tritici TaxID=56615 RepID=A0A5B0LHX1_PUCGR|nr:hypothetical protein PGT21_002605 [Puccinia graminis f. sp. tritici]
MQTCRSIRRYGKYMKDIMAVDQSTMNEFINSYVKNKWKEIFQDTKILKLSDIIHIHIEWAKMNDEKSLYVLMLKNPGQELETVSKIMERNLKKLELYHIIESVLENDRKLECSIEEIGFFILNQGGNAAEDSTSTAWNLEKVKRMFEEWKDYKAKNKIESSHSMILRKQFNILLPRVFGINTNLVQTLKREIGDHGQIWYQKHPWGPKFYLLPNLISTHLDWLQNNDQMPPSISEKVKLGVSLQHIAEELEPHFHKMNLDEFVLLVPFETEVKKKMFRKYASKHGGKIKKGHWDLENFKKLHEDWINSQKPKLNRWKRFTQALCNFLKISRNFSKEITSDKSRRIN